MLNSGIDRRPRSPWATVVTVVTLSLFVVPAAVLRGTQSAKPAASVAVQAVKPETALKVGGAIKPPRKIHDAKAVYPEAMKDAGITGQVELEVTIGKDGTVRKVHVLTTDAHPDLAVAAVDAVRQWKFESTLLNGAPVDVIVNCTVEFRLK
jgi:TonB family protein